MKARDLLLIVLDFSCGCALLLAFHRKDVPLLRACLPIMNDDIGPDGVVFAIDPDLFKVDTLPIEFNINKQALVDLKRGKEGGRKMVGQLVIDADLVQLAGIVKRVCLDRAVEQGAVFLGLPHETDFKVR